MTTSPMCKSQRSHNSFMPTIDLTDGEHHKQSRMKYIVTAYVPSCLTYCLCSALMIYANKYVSSMEHFYFPFSLLLFQNVCSVVLVSTGKACGIVEYPDYSAAAAKKWFPVVIFFVCMLVTGSFSLRYLSVPLVTIFKNLTNVGISFGDRFLNGQEVTNMVLLSLGVMGFGSFLGGYTDLYFHPMGYFWMFLNCTFTASYVLYLRSAMKTTQLGEFGMVFYNNLLSLPILIVFSIVMEGRGPFEAIESASSWFMIVVFFSGVIGFLLSLSSFWCVRVTSPTTYSIVGSLNKIPLSLASIVLFDTPVTSMGLLSLLVGLVGGVIYSYAKSVSIRQKMAAKESSRV